MGATGPTGPTGALATNDNASFAVNAATLPANTAITFSSTFINGSNIASPTSSTFALAIGHVYEVSYIVKTTVALAGSISVTPRFNGTAQNNFSTTATATLTALTTSVSGTFLVSAVAAAVTLDFLYAATLLASSPSGSVSIVMVQ